MEWVCSGKALLTRVAPGMLGAHQRKHHRSSTYVSISALLLTINLEGKHEHTVASKGYFVSSHFFQMQSIYLVFFLGPWGEEESLS